MLFVQVTILVAAPKETDAPDSSQVVPFFNNCWVAPADVPWAVQKLGR
jgi:hypothetical protein